MRTLSRQEARRVYDRIGARQDAQAFYEDRATSQLLRHGDFRAARAVFELGCGTGRFAAILLGEWLPADARYAAVDLSPRMVALARERLARFGPRAAVRLTEGEPRFEEADGSCDRFVSNFVLDLLSDDDCARVVSEAHRVLRPGGLLCLSGLAPGCTPLSRVVGGVWRRVHALRPAWVGGCRPLELRALVAGAGWELRHTRRLSAFGLASEALVAARR